MDGHPVDKGASGGRAPVNRPFVDPDWNWAVMRTDAQIFAILKHYRRVIGIAELAGALDNGLKRRTDVRWRGGDHIQDVGAAGLVSEGFLQVTLFRLHLVEQPRILDRNDRLVGKRLDQLDLPLSKGLHHRTREREGADRRAFSQQGDAEHGAEFAELLVS